MFFHCTYSPSSRGRFKKNHCIQLASTIQHPMVSGVLAKDFLIQPVWILWWWGTQWPQGNLSILWNLLTFLQARRPPTSTNRNPSSSLLCTLSWTSTLLPGALNLCPWPHWPPESLHHPVSPVSPSTWWQNSSGINSDNCSRAFSCLLSLDCGRAEARLEGCPTGSEPDLG